MNWDFFFFQIAKEIEIQPSKVKKKKTKKPFICSFHKSHIADSLL